MMKVSNVTGSVASAASNANSHRPDAATSRDASTAAPGSEAAGVAAASTIAHVASPAAVQASKPTARAAANSGHVPSVSQLKGEMERLQSQLQQTQASLNLALARPKSDDALSKAEVEMLQTRLSSTQSAIQTTNATLMQYAEQSSESSGGLLDISA